MQRGWMHHQGYVFEFMDNPNAALLIACKCKFKTCNVNYKIT